MPTLVSISFPVLTQAVSLLLEVNPLLSVVDLSSLEVVSTSVEFRELPALAEIELPALSAGGVLAWDVPELTSVSAPQLVDGTLVGVVNAPALTTLAAPSLQTLASSVSSLLVRETGLSSITLASLETAGGHLRLTDNPALTEASFPVLESVGGDFTVTDNGLLPTAEIEALRDQLLSSGGIGGSADISGNGP